MKYLVMCEGTNELTLINMLLDDDRLEINRDELIGRTPYNFRHLKNPLIRTSLKHFDGSVTIYRIGDKQNDELAIPKDLAKIIKRENIYKFCTKPEMEMLLIINEGLVNEYNKSGMSPKEFAKANIKLNGKRYDQSNQFLEEYYGNNIDSLVNNLKIYKKMKKKHNKDELYLADLLK